MSTDPEQRIATELDLSQVCAKLPTSALTHNTAIGTPESLTSDNLDARREPRASCAATSKSVPA
ncbi:hypothetical protein CH263_08270 [Rhodococcus sp. 06-1059B-a]|nr:hypothetical protein CH263_08270 [Rhodococcus sp. 06-1059B-a]